LEKERVPPQSYLFKWLLTLYTNVINLDAVSRIWDLFFLDGDIILYKAAVGIECYIDNNLIWFVAILKLKSDEILTKDLEGILKVLNNLNEVRI
jgi:hypothetical protein